LRSVVRGEIAHDYTRLKLPALQARLRQRLGAPG
jgi:hypothetical protein